MGYLILGFGMFVCGVVLVPLGVATGQGMGVFLGLVATGGGGITAIGAGVEMIRAGLDKTSARSHGVLDGDQSTR